MSSRKHARTCLCGECHPAAFRPRFTYEKHWAEDWPRLLRWNDFGLDKRAAYAGASDAEGEE